MEYPHTIALTGATGFIGTNLLQVLVRQGVNVRSLFRGGASKPVPDFPKVTWIKGDLGDERALERLVHGADAVIHCAGKVKALKTEEFFSVNRNGTEALIEALRQSNSRCRFIFISSLAARHPELSPYGRSKKEAEDLVKERCPGDWSILRPPAVYGPGDREILPLFRAMEKGLALIPAPKSNRFSLLHVLDLAEAVLEMTRSEKVLGKTLELHDGTPGGYSWNDVVDIFRAVTGKKLITVTLPPALLKIIGTLGLVASRTVSRPVMITPWKVREILHPDWVCNNHRENQGLFWSPRFTLKIALENGLIG